MLVGRHGAQMKQGDGVFVWGATGGIGAYGIQLVLNGGGTPVGVVSSPERGEAPARPWAARPSSSAPPRATGSGATSTPRTRASGAASARRSAASSARTRASCSSTPAAPRSGASVFIAKRGGTIVTCAATSGFMLEYDNRHLWMKLKRIVSVHFANYQEAWDMNRLISQGAHPAGACPAAYHLTEVGDAALLVHQNKAEGKLRPCSASPRRGPRHHQPREARARIGEDKITPVPAPRECSDDVRINIINLC